MNTILRSTVWAGGGLLAGAGTTYVVALSLRPRDPVGFEELGWALLFLAVGAAMALLTGALALHHGLRAVEGGGRTVVVFVPVALALASVTAGVGALAAAPLARWLVERLALSRG